MSTSWIPKTKTSIITEIQRLASKYLWKKYTKTELELKHSYWVNYYKNQCKEYWKKYDKWVALNRWNKILYAILEIVKKEIRQKQNWSEQTTLF